MGCDWHSPENVRSPILRRVHVWCLNLVSPGHVPLDYTKILDASELARADRFHFARDREKFILRRVALRKLLGHYLQIEPGEICFKSNEFGKPALAERFISNLQFNLSSSGELALLVFSKARVGVDVEKGRMDIDTASIAKRFFSPKEQDALARLPAGLYLQGFYNCWTRKEAVVKALGQGLTLALDRFDVSVAPGEPVKVLEARDTALEALTLSLLDISPAKGYTAALAVQGTGWQVDCWRFSDQLF